MSQQRKAVRTVRSREDHELFKFILPSYNPGNIADVTIQVNPGEYLVPERPFGALTIRPQPPLPSNESPSSEPASLEQPLTANMGGTV
jgi:hypothetical protein